MVGWAIAGGILLLMILTVIFVRRWRRRLTPGTAPVAFECSEQEPAWKKYKIEDVFNGDMIPVDYDPDRDGEFAGNPGMIPALAAIQLGGTVMMNQLDDGSWEIRGPDGAVGRGETPSEAYGQILRKIKQDLN